MIRFVCVALLLSGCYKYQPPAHLPVTWHSPLLENMETESPCCFCWWKSLNDPMLNELIRQASLKNFDLLIARETNGADSCALWRSLSADVAKSYCELCGLQLRLELIKKNKATQLKTVQLTKNLMEGGFVGFIDQVEAEALLSQLEAKKPLIELALHKTIHHLSTLLGYAPGDLCEWLTQTHAVPSLPCQIPVGTPSEFFERKFDIRRVMRNKAAMGVKQGSKRYYSYEKTAIEALELVENNLTTLYFTEESYQELQKASERSLEAYHQTYQLYERGLKDYLEVLMTQRSLLSTEEALVETHVQLLIAYIELYKNLEK